MTTDDGPWRMAATSTLAARRSRHGRAQRHARQLFRWRPLRRARRARWRRPRAWLAEGAAIIDVGGESTRPGAEPVTAAEEQARILPVIEALAGDGDALISVDTYREETARLAVAAGAHIVNDVWGLQREPGIARVAAETGAGLVIMHTGREREKLPDVIADQFAFLETSLEIAAQAGVARRAASCSIPASASPRMRRRTCELMARFRRTRCARLSADGRHLAQALHRPCHRPRRRRARDAGTAATSVILRLKGADLFRVHDVAINVDALAFADAMLAREQHAAES